MVESRGTVGEGDLGPFTNIGAAMVGAGTAYFRGARMPAAQALEAGRTRTAGALCRRRQRARKQQRLHHGQAALLLHDAREALSWADLIYAIDLNGMNSSISPLSQPVQANRPFKWLIGTRSACSKC